MSGLFGGFSSKKLKPQLKMACSRLQISSNKKSAIMKQQMREIAVMLAEDPPKEEKAKIRAEALIREDNCIEAYEILMLNCELLSERIKLLETQKQCPPDLQSCISTLIWASDRVDITEFPLIRKQFKAKYGKEFEENALNNVGGILNDRVVSKLSVQPPAAYLVQTYLEKICDQYEVDWKPAVSVHADNMAEPTAAPIGYSVQIAPGTGLAGGQTTGVGTAGSNNNNNNNDDGYGGGGGGGVYDIPVAPGAVTATPVNNPSTSPKSSEPFIPPAPGSTPKNNNNNDNDDDFGDVDIFIPPIPSAPSSSKDTTPKNGGDDGASTGTGTGASSYDDLASRFEQLKK